MHHEVAALMLSLFHTYQIQSLQESSLCFHTDNDAIEVRIDDFYHSKLKGLLDATE